MLEVLRNTFKTTPAAADRSFSVEEQIALTDALGGLLHAFCEQQSLAFLLEPRGDAIRITLRPR